MTHLLAQLMMQRYPGTTLGVSSKTLGFHPPGLSCSFRKASSYMILLLKHELLREASGVKVSKSPSGRMLNAPTEAAGGRSS